MPSTLGAARDRNDVLDELLVLRCQAGDARALEQLAGRWHRRLLAQACRLTRQADAASDLVQETWLAIVHGLRRLDDPARFRAWAYRILANKYRDGQRRSIRQRQLNDRFAREPHEAEAAAAPIGDVDGEVQIERLRSVLNGLDPQRRALVSMFYLESLSVAEIAAALAIPPGTVKSRLFHLRRLLRAKLEDTEPKEESP